MSNYAEPTRFDYSHWRHGGWYVHNVRYPDGACGCVSRNYADRKWRIACDPRPFDEQPTFKNRDEAARAEWRIAEALRDVADEWNANFEALAFDRNHALELAAIAKAESTT